MTSESQKQILTTSKSTYYKIRPSYYIQALHLSDSYSNLGYNYRGKILRKMTSAEIWANPIQWNLYDRLESIIVFLIEQVKYIKKTFSIAHSKESININ